MQPRESQAGMVELDKIRIFYYVVLEGSLVKAAKLVGCTSASISKNISSLEKKLGVKLIFRKKNGVQLTEEGQSLFKAAKSAIKELEATSNALRGQTIKKEPQEILRIMTTSGISCIWLIRKMKIFVDSFPHLTVKIYTSDHPIDFQNSKADVGILPHVINSKKLTFRKIKTFNHYLYASNQYIKKMGMPETKEDLTNHQMIGFYHESTGFRGDCDWHLRLSRSKQLPPLTINSAFGQLEAARMGYGITTCPEEHPYLESAGMIKILPKHFKRIPIFFVTPAYKIDTPAVKSLFDCLNEKED